MKNGSVQQFLWEMWMQLLNSLLNKTNNRNTLEVTHLSDFFLNKTFLCPPNRRAGLAPAISKLNKTVGSSHVRPENFRILQPKLRKTKPRLSTPHSCDINPSLHSTRKTFLIELVEICFKNPANRMMSRPVTHCYYDVLVFVTQSF